jgi:hypothetical protein
MTAETLRKSDLAQFTGSENWYRHGINRNPSRSTFWKLNTPPSGRILLDVLGAGLRAEQ